MSALATNDEIKEAVLTMRKAGGEAVDYFFITLKRRGMTQVEHATTSDGDTSEEVTFAFPRSRSSTGGRPAAAGAAPRMSSPTKSCPAA